MKLSAKDKKTFGAITASTDVYSHDILKMQGNWAAPKKIEQALRDEISSDDTVIEVKATYTPERDTTIIAFKYIDKSATKDFAAVKSSTTINAAYGSITDPNNVTISELMSRIDVEQPDLWDDAVKYLDKWLDNPEDVWADDCPDWEIASWGIGSDNIITTLKSALETGVVEDMYTS